MKYYKLLDKKRYNSEWEVGNIYPENYKINKDAFKVSYLVKQNPERWEEVLIEETVEPTFPRRMLVWDSPQVKRERLVLCKLPGKRVRYVALAGEEEEKRYENGENYATCHWKYAEELPIEEEPVQEMTLEEVCKELGRNIKIVKG